MFWTMIDTAKLYIKSKVSWQTNHRKKAWVHFLPAIHCADNDILQN